MQEGPAAEVDAAGERARRSDEGGAASEAPFGTHLAPVARPRQNLPLDRLVRIDAELCRALEPDRPARFGKLRLEERDLLRVALR